MTPFEVLFGKLPPVVVFHVIDGRTVIGQVLEEATIWRADGVPIVLAVHGYAHPASDDPPRPIRIPWSSIAYYEP